MIRKLIDRIFSPRKAAGALGRRVETPGSGLGIDPSRLPNSALTVVRTLQQAGFEFQR